MATLCFLLFLVSLSVVQGLHKDGVGIAAQAEPVALVADHRQPEPVSLQYPGVLGPLDPLSASKNAKEVTEGPVYKLPSGIPIGPVGPQRRTDIFSDLWTPQVEAIESARGWLPPVDPHSAARNVKRLSHDSAIVQRDDKEEAQKKDADALKGTLIVFCSMYAPLSLLWLYFYRQGLKEVHFLVLIPLTYVLMQIGEDLVSQSLVDRMHGATFPLLVLKALAVVSLFGQWLFLWGRQYLRNVHMSALPFAVLVVGPLYACYQLLNHALYSDYTLAEHVVFTNFCPPLVFFGELLLMPLDLQPKVNRNIKLSLCAIVVGAVVFCIEGARCKITWSMLAYAGIMLLYYASQRWYVTKKTEVPIPLLIIINGCVLLLPAIILSSTVSPQWSSASHWIHNKSVIVMIILAAATYAFKIYLSMLMLSTGSATGLLVNGNLANFGIIILGLLLFGKASGMNAPCLYIGLFVSLPSCLWYCYEAVDARTAKKYCSDSNADNQTLKNNKMSQFEQPRDSFNNRTQLQASNN